MDHGEDRRAGGEGRRGGQHVLGFLHQVGGDLGAAVGDVVLVVVPRLVVRGHLGAERRLDHADFRGPGEHRPQPSGQPGHRDPQQGAQPGSPGDDGQGSPGDDGQLRSRLPQPVGDVARGDQRGEGAGDGEQAQCGQHAGADLAREQPGRRAPVNLPRHPQRPAHQHGQAPRHRGRRHLRAGLKPGLVPVQELLLLRLAPAVRSGSPLPFVRARLCCCAARGQVDPPVVRHGWFARLNDAAPDIEHTFFGRS